MIYYILAAISSLNLSYWSIGSFNSENAFPYSLPSMNISNLSVNLGSFGDFLANGDISTG